MTEHFTPEKVNALLPRLGRWLTDIQAKKQHLGQVQKKLVELAITAAGDGRLAEEELNSAEREAERLSKETDKLLEQIRALGCEVKDIDRGIIDFPARRQGQRVYLCWQLGEEKVAFWHDLRSGFAGRQPL
jgi:hypothetical protein